MLANEVQVEKSVRLGKRLPMFITVNIFWASVCLCVIARYQPWPIIPATLMVVLMTLIWTTYKKARKSSKSHESIRNSEYLIVFHFFAIGAFWCIGILKYLPSLPLEVRLFLAGGCLLLIFGASITINAMPAISLVYSFPIFFAVVVIACSVAHSRSLLAVAFFLFAAVTLGWITFENWKDFSISARIIAERNQFFTLSKAAVVARNQFLENISHEIKTPLTAILGYTRLLAVDKFDGRTGREEIFKRLEASAVSLTRTTDVLLDATKLNAGQLALNEKTFDLRLLLTKILELVKKTNIKKNIDFEIGFSPDIPKLTSGDPQRIEQIFFNLLENALKFTDCGRIAVHVSYSYPRPSLSLEKMFCISVTDTGIGIDVANRELIFRSFYQIDGSLTRRQGGMGLGLAVSRMLANLMKGDLDLESNGSSGTTFKCWLPLQINLRVESSALIDLPLSTTIQKSERQHNVLVVDDDVYIRHYLDVLLARDGWIVELCDGGLSAISKCAIQKYDLILMDIQMPMMTGIDASKIIWSGSQNASTPILVMTGYLSIDRIAELRLAGLMQHINKPLVAEDLLARARDAIIKL